MFKKHSSAVFVHQCVNNNQTCVFKYWEEPCWCFWPLGEQLLWECVLLTGVQLTTNSYENMNQWLLLLISSEHTVNAWLWHVRKVSTSGGSSGPSIMQNSGTRQCLRSVPNKLITVGLHLPFSRKCCLLSALWTLWPQLCVWWQLLWGTCRSSPPELPAWYEHCMTPGGFWVTGLTEWWLSAV